MKSSGEPLRLVYITVSMPFGPEEAFLVAEANELTRQGCDMLIVPRSPKGKIFNQDAVGLGRRSLRRPLLGPSVVFFALLESLRRPGATIRALKLVMQSQSARTRIKNGAAFPKGLWLACVARKWRADHIHAHWGTTTATMALVAGEVTRIPWSLTLHRDDIAHPNLLGAKMEKAFFTRFISRSGLEIARDVGALVPSDRSRVIHMGVSIPELPPAARTGTRIFTLLCPAHLYPVKGQEYLVDAVAILHDRELPCLLLLVGQGGLRTSLEQQVARLDLTAAIRFLGQVPHEKIVGWYQEGAIDAVVLPSVDLGEHEHEGIPVSLMEAMAYAIPVVSTSTGGVPELLGEGAGVIVRPRDPTALADAVERLIRDPLLRSRLGAAGRQRIKEQYSVERTSAELLACIRAGPSGGSL